MEKPILFNTEMVRAILEGRKTCTRRIVKPQPAPCNHGIYKGDKWKNEPSKWIIADEGYAYCGLCGNGINFNGKGYLKTPYKVGDILYVRETWKQYEKRVGKGKQCHLQKFYGYKADADNPNNPSEFYEGNWKPSIHMPKVAARIFLKVINVRVERLKDITEEGAKAEGATKQIWYQPYGTRSENNQEYVGDITHHEPNYITGFAGIWDRTLGKYDDWLYAFKENPWVWVIEFERVRR